MFDHGETATWFPSETTRSPIGQTKTTFGDPVDLPGVGFAPQTTQEPRDGTQVRVVTEALLYIPTGVLPGGRGINPGDEITVRGDRYAVEGTVGGWTNPFTGWSPGAEVRLRRVADA